MREDPAAAAYYASRGSNPPLTCLYYSAVCSRDEQDVKRQTEALLKRDAARKKYDPEYNADDIIGDDTPAEAMQPTFKDPALWRIQCKQGLHERI